MDLRIYDVILINTSAGKDSLAMMHYVHQMAVEQGVVDRLRAVHCDLGRMEWTGTRELAEKQCRMYGIPLTVVSRPQGDLLQHVEERGKWPSSAARYCTSDHKRGQVDKVFTAIVEELGGHKGEPVSILNCMGLRAQESSKRRKKPVLQANERASNTKRMIVDWLPIHGWTLEQVWECIRTNGLPYHYAYDLGMPRLSCVFCIFAPEKALLLAGYHNRKLLEEYVDVESKIGHSFKYDSDAKKEIPLIQIQAQLVWGYVPTPVDPNDWKQCA